MTRMEKYASKRKEIENENRNSYEVGIPYSVVTMGKDNVPIMYCPVCQHELCWGNCSSIPNYCSNCGQKIKNRN